jgi:hypothetical protein
MIIREILWRDSDYTGCIWRHSGDADDYSTLEWVEGNTLAKPSEAELVGKWAAIKAKIVGEKLRSKRNKLLVESDWMVLVDRTPSTEQLAYRQALRDLPANSPNANLDEYGQLTGVTWPTKPE